MAGAGTLTIVAPINSPRQFPREVLHAATKVTITFQVREFDQVTVVDLTGLVPRLRLRRDVRDAVNLFESADGTVATPASGNCTIDVPTTAIPDADELWGELVLEDGAGDEVSQIAFKFHIGAGAGVAA